MLVYVALVLVRAFILPSVDSVQIPCCIVPNVLVMVLRIFCLALISIEVL